jgi:hypothetical protein
VTRPINDGKRYGERRYYVFVGGPPPPPTTATPPESDLRWKQADTLARDLAHVHGVAGLYTIERPLRPTKGRKDPLWPGWRWFHTATYRRPGFIDNTGWYGGVLPGTAEPPSSRAKPRKVHNPFFTPKTPEAAARYAAQDFSKMGQWKRKRGKGKGTKKKPAPLTPPQAEAHTASPAPASAAPRAVPPIKRPRPLTTTTPTP